MKPSSVAIGWLVAVLAVPCFAAPPAGQPKIQIAILLDTSGSMDGLINQTREQLWRIVNTFTTAKRQGRPARLELALYQYGNDRLRTANWIERIVPLTTDLDRVSEALFKLSTNGGNEYCGAAIAQATKELEWSQNPGDLKLIYIAGNEPFTQGPVDFRAAVKAAIARGVVVNTIHAGNDSDGVSGGWREAAALADGNYLVINHNQAVVRIDAPQDQELVRLNAELNKTYVGFGPSGVQALERQRQQDRNAAATSAGSMATRAAAKSSAHYTNADWDLVDAKRAGQKVEEMPAEKLPEPMRAMSKAERAEFVGGKEKERAALQAEISKLAEEREAYVRTEMKRRAGAADKTMDDALIESAKSQALKQAYSF